MEKKIKNNTQAVKPGDVESKRERLIKALQEGEESGFSEIPDVEVFLKKLHKKYAFMLKTSK